MLMSITDKALLRYYRVTARIQHYWYYYDATRILSQSSRGAARTRVSFLRIKVQFSVGYFQDATRALEKSW